MPPTLGVRGGGEGVRLEAAAARLGWRETETDWRRVLQRDDVDLVDVCTPGDTPAEIAIPPLEAGEHRPLGDIGAHIVDLTQHITGQRLTGVSALLETFVKERPLPASEGSLSGVAGQGTGTVTVDDAAVFLGRFDGGALASFEATRFALGRKNAIRIEVNGSRGSLAFDFEDMNVLHFYDGDEPAATAGFRRIIVTEPDHPYVGAWWPAGGPTCRSRRWPGSPPSGATTAWRSPAGATTSTSSAPRTTTPTCRSASPCSTSTACRSGPSPTTSTARPSATTRSTSGTAAWCTRASGGTATPRASGSGRPRR